MMDALQQGMLENLAETAYSEHEIAGGRVNRGNQPLFPWSEMPDFKRQEWREVVLVVLRECTALSAKWMDNL